MTEQSSTAAISLAAYTAARQSAAWFDRSDAGRLWMAGADLGAWLQGMLTNDVSGRRAGDGFYAAYLTPQGRMVSDLRLLVFETGMLADVPGAVREALLRRLEMFIITEDVAVRDVTSATRRVEIVGPAAAAAVTRALAAIGFDPDSGGNGARDAKGPALADRLSILAEHAHLMVAGPGRGAAVSSVPDSAFTPAGDLAEVTVVIAASHDAGAPGFDVYAEPATHGRLVAALDRAGVAALDAATWHVLRVEAGRPLFGFDLGEETLPPEAGLDVRAVSYTKGCFVGQEILVRLRDIGHGRVSRRLVTLRLADPRAPGDSPEEGRPRDIAAGAVLEAGGRRVGHVTSSVRSPLEGGPLAFGYVHRDSLSPGTRLDAVSPGSRVLVVVGTPVGAAGTAPPLPRPGPPR